MMIFHDRIDAGKRLALLLDQYQDEPNAIVLGLPRGGVPVAFEVARALHLPLDVFLVRKIGVPWNEELAMGAIAMGGVQVFNEEIIKELLVPPTDIDQMIAEQENILARRNALYRKNKPVPNFTDKVVILIDDGIATGATLRAAVRAIKKLGCKKIVVATPVAPRDSVEVFRNLVDEIYVLETPEPFFAIGSWYQNFTQTEDQEVCDLLEQANSWVEKE